jgi:Ser/Thr protein kinase RdoA (MazF antagonist)
VDLDQEREWQRLIRSWGPDAEVLGRLGGGARGDVREVRVENRRGVGRLSGRSRAALDWELDLLARLAEAGLRVPSLIPTGSGARRADYLVITEWINAREPAPEDDARRGRYLRRLHELTEGWEQRPGFRTARELVTMMSSGDVNMAALPDTVATACRATWSALPAGPLCVVHGDPDPDDCLVSYDGDIVQIDWDEARVDHPWFDLAVLPPEASGLTEKQWHLARRASCAWEVAARWESDPEYARRRLRELKVQP